MSLKESSITTLNDHIESPELTITVYLPDGKIIANDPNQFKVKNGIVWFTIGENDEEHWFYNVPCHIHDKRVAEEDSNLYSL